MMKIKNKSGRKDTSRSKTKKRKRVHTAPQIVNSSRKVVPPLWQAMLDRLEELYPSPSNQESKDVG